MGVGTQNQVAERVASGEAARLVERVSGWVPEGWAWWAVPVILVVLAVVAHAVVFAVLRGALKKKELPRRMVVGLSSPVRWAAVFAALAVYAGVMTAAADGGEVYGRLTLLLSVLFVAALTWVLIRAVGEADDFILHRYDLTSADNRRARHMHTKTRVLSRTVQIVIGVVGGASALMVVPQVREVGVSLLASAGIAGLVVGMAARPTLSNLIAGVQIALTEPIALDDVVIMEGEWGRIEEIATTYVVVRVWDQRRLIVPLTQVIESPFQNWTRRTSELLGTVMVHTDYRVSVEGFRGELKRICEGAGEWDGRVCLVQVTDADAAGVQVRALVSAEDAGKLWDLRCKVREGLIVWLNREHPESLPRTRFEGDLPAGAGGGAGEGGSSGEG